MVPNSMSPPVSTGIYRFGIYEVDFSSGELRKSGVRQRLPEAFRVLLLMLERPSEIVTRDELWNKALAKLQQIPSRFNRLRLRTTTLNQAITVGREDNRIYQHVNRSRSARSRSSLLKLPTGGGQPLRTFTVAGSDFFPWPVSGGQFPQVKHLSNLLRSSWRPCFHSIRLGPI